MLRLDKGVVLTCLLVSALAVAGVAPPAAATIVRGFSMRGLTVESHSIVRGEVIDEEVVYDATGHRVYTHTFVQVRETLAGAERPGDIVVVRQLGGSLDGLEQLLVGTAHLGLGDEVVLFTRTDGAFHYLVGMAQGAWFVTRTTPDAPAVLRRTMDAGLALVAHPASVAARVPANLTTLDTLRARVATVLAEVSAGAESSPAESSPAESSPAESSPAESSPAESSPDTEPSEVTR